MLNNILYTIGNNTLAAGLSALSKNLIDNWIGPIYLVIVAAVAITLALKKEIRALVAFLIVAVICGLLVYFGSEIFGKSGSATNALQKAAKDIQYVFVDKFTWLKG